MTEKTGFSYPVRHTLRLYGLGAGTIQHCFAPRRTERQKDIGKGRALRLRDGSRQSATDISFFSMRYISSAEVCRVRSLQILACAWLIFGKWPFARPGNASIAGQGTRLFASFLLILFGGRRPSNMVSAGLAQSLDGKINDGAKALFPLRFAGGGKTRNLLRLRDTSSKMQLLLNCGRH